MRCFSLALLLLTATCIDIPHAEIRAGDNGNAEASRKQNLREEIAEGFNARINVIGFGLTQQVVDSTLNWDNVLEIPRHRAEIDIRPDFYLNFRRLVLGLKPRWELRWEKWEDGVRDGDSDTHDEVFVNEWLARLRLTDQLFVSYSRENLQWGPSFLLSPSNPFNQDNGRNNPSLELPGLDYARVMWIPSIRWTASFIVNTDEGRQELIQDFQETYAIKVDYVGEKKFFSLIPSYQDGEDFVFGFFAGWTVSDPLLLHGEGSVSNEDDDARVLVGGSYTLETGPTITLEYFRNQAGCTLEPIERCFGLETDSWAKNWAGVQEQTLRDMFERRYVEEAVGMLVRKNYALLQYTDAKIRDSINLTLRWIHNFDDTSDQAVGIFEYELGDHAQLFVIGDFFLGGEDTEFGSLLDYLLMAGISYTL